LDFDDFDFDFVFVFAGAPPSVVEGGAFVWVSSFYTKREISLHQINAG
jgi:hypothetical protein